MEDPSSHQKERKRSCDNNAFAKFVPFSPPLELDGEPHEIHHGHKRLRPNSEPSFSETITNLSTSLPKQNIGTKEALDFSSPSTSVKHLVNIGSSPPSIGSKSQHIEYHKNDEQFGRIVSAGQCQRKEEQNQSELESVISMAAEELSKRPRTAGTTYKAIASQRECIMKRLKDLSNEEPTVDVGLEMADAAYLLKLMSFSNNEIELAGQKGHKGALLLLQAEILRKKGQELISECQNLVRDTL